MAVKNLYMHAMLAAEQVIQDHGITELAVDPIEIAKANDIEVEAKPASASGVSGMIIRVGDSFGIGYATHIDSIGFQRFSIAHELGHYFLPEHPDAVFGPDGRHESRAGFGSGDRYEIEADHFAASLLMPDRLFTAAMRQAGEGLDAIEYLSDKCETSLPATAIRFTQCSREPVAIVVSEGALIRYAFMSDELKEADDIEWIKKGTPLPRASETFTFNNGAEKSTDRKNGASNFKDWFGGEHSFEIAEDVMGLGSYGKTLTILYEIELPGEDDEDDLDDSWTPRFKR